MKFNRDVWWAKYVGDREVEVTFLREKCSVSQTLSDRARLEVFIFSENGKS